MKMLFLACLVGLMTACNSMTYESGQTKFTRSAVGTRNSITELLVEVDPVSGLRKIHMKGYHNDQVDALGVVTEAAVRSAMKAAMPAP